ncbi:MAG TPA: NUDIX domain-containing protein [Armatimonadetes bacterium]|jgi:8-oxo-dGTP pyrophosphatase MutT (NUDIX family)|nr:NUDIX domain-containing protein [Armatimonadota bacterium]
MADYNKVGLLVIREDRVLLCRKRGLSRLILPGGTLEAGETPEACLHREIHEELGDVVARDLEYIGTYRDRAASDDPSVVKTVEIQLYRGEITGRPVASSEIEALVWFGRESDREELSPILIHSILPDLAQRGMLGWGV